MKQGIYQQSETPKYPIGLRFVKDDRVFRYCNAGNALESHYGAFNENVPKGLTIGAGQGGAIGSVIVIGACVGVTKDMFAEGYLVTYVTPFQCIRIKSNTATVGGNITVTLYDPLIAAIGAAEMVGLYHNLYSSVIHMATSEYMSVVCMPLIAVTNKYYFWGQTWGPVPGLVAGGDTEIGKTAKSRMVFWTPDQGGIKIEQDSTHTDGEQIAGFLLCDGSSFANGDQFFMLQLSP